MIQNIVHNFKPALPPPKKPASFQQKPASSEISVLNTTTSPTVIKIKADGYCFYNAGWLSAINARQTEAVQNVINSAQAYLTKNPTPPDAKDMKTKNQVHYNQVYDAITTLSKLDAKKVIENKGTYSAIAYTKQTNFGSALKVLANEYLCQHAAINGHVLQRDYIRTEKHQDIKKHAYSSTWHSTNGSFVDNLEGDLNISLAHLFNLNINRIESNGQNNTIFIKNAKNTISIKYDGSHFDALKSNFLTRANTLKIG